MAEHPQNPYESFIVEASAGSGKTYQLSHRYLNLLATQAPIARILTITFTRKAAAEMKQRIIEEAVYLARSKERQRDFDAALEQYYRQHCRVHGNNFPRPLSALNTAELVLNSSQLMKITTIDALFFEWCSRFAWEASQYSAWTSNSATIELADSVDTESFQTRAWEHVIANATSLKLPLIPQKGLLALEAIVRELHRHYTFIWKVRCSRPQLYFAHKVSVQSEEEIFAAIKPALVRVVGQLKNPHNYEAALCANKIDALIAARLVTASGEISRIILRGKKREALAEELGFIGAKVGQYLTASKLESLDSNGLKLLKLYDAWLAQCQKIKTQLSLLEFHDLALGAYTIFHHPDAVGASWAIQSSYDHLLIDELQDTSLLQWSVFEKCCEEILSGEPSPYSPSRTAFLVGDQKQSIYGFREADMEVLARARALFLKFGKESVALHRSYRSVPKVLDYVNALFSQHIDPNFPHHASALGDEYRSHGRILVMPLAKGDDKPTALKAEALGLAEYLAQAFSDPNMHPILVGGKVRGLRPGDCAVLYRNATHANVFAEALRAAGILVCKEGEQDFFASSAVSDLLRLLKFLHSPRDLVSLLALLHSPLVAIDEEEILVALAQAGDEGVASQALLAKLETLAPEKLAPMLSCLGACERLAPAQLFAKIVQDFKIFDLLSSLSPSSPSSLHGDVLRLWELVIQCEQQGCYNLGLLLERLKRLELCKAVRQASSSADSVRLMTIHKAKGLEFPFVALVEASDPWFRLDRYWAKLADTQMLSYVGAGKERPQGASSLDTILANSSEQLRQESDRLLYVALTRASQYLCISAHAKTSPRWSQIEAVLGR